VEFHGRFLLLQAAIRETRTKPTFEENLQHRLSGWQSQLDDWKQQTEQRRV